MCEVYIQKKLFRNSISSVNLYWLFGTFMISAYRLHAVDALVCPLWLVLLLIYHPGIAHTSNSITAYQLVTTAVTAMLLLISLLIHRNLKNLPKQHIRRLEMVLSFRVQLLSIKNQNCQSCLCLQIFCWYQVNYQRVGLCLFEYKHCQCNNRFRWCMH